MTWRVRLIHWNAAEAEEKAAPLVAAGYDVAYETINPTTLREMRENPPDAVVIDLTRLPSQGRDIGLLLRKYKTTRHVPLVFVEGGPDKVARIKELLPDAVYSEWSRIRSSLKRVMAHPLKDVVVPESSFAAYAGAPLVKKLGIKTNSVVALVNAPQDFEKTLGELPEGSTLRRQARGRNHVAQAPAGDGKRFAQSTDGNGPLPQRLQAAGKDVLAPVIDDLVIDFVGDKHQIVPQHQVSHSSQFLGVKDTARRVVRRIQQQGAGAGRNRMGQPFRVQAIVGGFQGHSHRLRPSKNSRRDIVLVGRLDDQQLVAGIQDG